MTDASQVPTRTFRSDDGPLAYLDVGSGTPLVLLHGGFTDHRMWRDLVPALAAGHRVIAPDARGHGASANASRPFRLTDDLAALLRHLDTGPAVLIGMSMGGGTAVDTALEHPGLVRALVVSGVGTSEPEHTDPWTKDSVARYYGTLMSGDIEGWLDVVGEAVAGPHRTVDDVDPEIVRRVREMSRATAAKHTVGETDWHVPVTDTWARAATITAPTLAINGALDAPDLIAMAERLTRTVAGRGRAVSMEGTAHYANMEQPDTFNKHLLDWLSTLDTETE
ncbi:alpha/beta fold hydrolase [Streptomyces europaeiscabiei]|uniref:Alpha/beta hydrolase n=1 Tax=Streptomyces europaeiscabiei TaxID=146819 RepID=A0ABU4NAT8_9ACTN|nr:alpha/beta hydrolase [Streptomyces europaeiscabiei]MDX2526626.1 alpha/beta hydrolase [Streptomyces europaeiscabiei]MDX2772945.1 alpha/beta hydrolase [Streptomyces europaeiscabiei]MDX3541608.1 alpha/beta hydrolase [Streptomyces europaeiscabiei]MDX3551949.1 alpha/beta hydrolase [Streptomyces europaeiscabiei]MDX3700188.1 alpha/beta hydrolase [Streptomyces europaeiscabiei]